MTVSFLFSLINNEAKIHQEKEKDRVCMSF